jgi:hypothetical protein
MKKLSFGVICALGILGTGCDMEIPNDQIEELSLGDLCSFSGGDYNTKEKSCYCDGIRCGANVSCVVSPSSNKYECASGGNLDYPEYTCTLQGMMLCFDRITIAEDGSTMTSGYYVECNGTSWSTPKPCESGYSCSAYMEHDVYYSTKCGECNNKDSNCIRGTKKD